MSNTFYIQSSCLIRDGKVIQNGKALPLSAESSVNEFTKALYQYLQLDYPKFFKMDELCKLALLATELVVQDSVFNELAIGETAVILSNHSSTLETDSKHQESISDEKNYFPSPAVFVYTLPNITIGEIAIRHKLKGENTFFVSESYDSEFMCRYTNLLLSSKKAERVLTGWVEYQKQGYTAFIYLIGRDQTAISLEHHPKNVDNLYKTGLPV